MLMPTMDLIRVKKVFCTPKLSQDKDYGDRAFKFHQKCDRTTVINQSKLGDRGFIVLAVFLNSVMGFFDTLSNSDKGKDNIDIFTS